MPRVVLGFVFIIFGAASAWDGFRITNTVRTPGVFDLVGPDRYLLALGALLAILGAVMIGSVMRSAPAGDAVAVSTNNGSRVHVWLFALTSAYVGAILIAGYAAATLLFFVLAFRLLGLRDWRRNLPTAVALAVIYYVLFIHLADMPLPKGLITDLLD